MNWSLRARRARRWRRAEWALLPEAWAALLWAWWALRRAPLPTIVDRLSVEARAGAPVGEVAPVVRAVQRAAHLFPMPLLCLPQSLALARLLARRGHPCELVLGARPRDARLDAHAWVEQQGLPLNSAPDSATLHPVLLRAPIRAG